AQQEVAVAVVVDGDGVRASAQHGRGEGGDAAVEAAAAQQRGAVVEADGAQGRAAAGGVGRYGRRKGDWLAVVHRARRRTELGRGAVPGDGQHAVGEGEDVVQRTEGALGRDNGIVARVAAGGNGCQDRRAADAAGRQRFAVLEAGDLIGQ